MKTTICVTARGHGIWGERRAIELATITVIRWSQDRSRHHVKTTYDVLPADPAGGSRTFRSTTDRETFLADSFSELQLTQVDPAEERERAHPLGELIGTDLAAVHFVRDYVQLQFDDALLYAYVWPRVHRDGSVLHHGQPGFNDALIQLIDQRVTGVDEVLDLGLVLDLDNGAVRLTIPLDGTDLVGPEIAELAGKGGLFVWQADGDVPWFPPAR